MKHSIHFRRLLLVAILALAAWPMAQLAHAGLQEPDVPTRVAVEEGHKLFLIGHAVGVQIYSCNVIPNGYGWGLLAPRADLFDDNGKLIMTHFGGPTWRSNDGSSVRAQRVDGVTVNASAIPWLLLRATSPAPGPDGDRLVETTFIQRIATTGGLAPPDADCNASTVGGTREVDYTADYYFWKEDARARGRS